LSDSGCFAQGPDHLVVVAVADQDQRIPFLGKFDSLHVDLCDKRACSIDDAQLAQMAPLPNFRRDAVSAINHSLALGNFLDTVDENRTFRLEFLDHKAVMDDFLADVDRGAKGLKSNADDVDCPYHARAKAPRLQQK